MDTNQILRDVRNMVWQAECLPEVRDPKLELLNDGFRLTIDEKRYVDIYRFLGTIFFRGLFGQPDDDYTYHYSAMIHPDRQPTARDLYEKVVDHLLAA